MQEIQFYNKVVRGDGGALTFRPSSEDLATPFTRSEIPAASRNIGDILILGAGVSGLVTAYELLKIKKKYKLECKVTILEAADRVGGRSLTLRNNDEFTEVIKEGPLQGKRFKQKCKLETQKGAPYPAYLNAGPGRIPSAHTGLLQICKEIGVDLEVYIMESRSNLVYPWTKDLKLSPLVNRRVANDVRGHIAIDLYNRLPEMGAEKYKQLLRSFGALTLKEGSKTEYEYKGSQRSGYIKAAGTEPGVVIPPIPMEFLLGSEFWRSAVNFYQPEDYFWQTSSFQPVGGMDMIEKKLAEKIKAAGGEILLNSKVTRIDKTDDEKSFVIEYLDKDKPCTIKGEWCFCNIPILLMKDILVPAHFEPDFVKAITRVMDSPGFFEPTCKVGWQAPRKLWQRLDGMNEEPPVLPILGGISFTSHPMKQMWYPSDRINDELGVLTGAYNYTQNATEWGKLKPEDRLKAAREGAAELHGKEFAEQLKSGITIAWQNMPLLGGGWSNWKNLKPLPNEKNGLSEAEIARIMNLVREGSNKLHMLGDQVSFIPGWKEGAVAAAYEAVGHILDKVEPSLYEYKIRPVTQTTIPDTAALVYGHEY
jgi:monoamine oxidase